MSLRGGLALSSARLREPGTLSACALGLCFELGVALLERAQGRVGATDRALTGGAFGVTLPLLCYWLVQRACGGSNLRDALLPLSRHGASRYELGLGLGVPPALIAALFAALSSVVVVGATRGLSDPLLLQDIATCLWIAVVSACAYTLAFVGASGYGPRGQGRIGLLAADFVLGAGGSFLALPWPKSHVRNLLGGAPVLELSQLGSLVLLLGTSFACLSAGLLHTKR